MSFAVQYRQNRQCGGDKEDCGEECGTELCLPEHGRYSEHAPLRACAIVSAHVSASPRTYPASAHVSCTPNPLRLHVSECMPRQSSCCVELTLPPLSVTRFPHASLRPRRTTRGKHQLLHNNNQPDPGNETCVVINKSYRENGHFDLSRSTPSVPHRLCIAQSTSVSPQKLGRHKCDCPKVQTKRGDAVLDLNH